MITDDEFEWTCQYCGEPNSVWVDLTVMGRQEFIEDCSICCRPNIISITTDGDENVFIESHPENE